MGNRLTETTAKGETAYTYDTTNRLTSVNGQAVQWDDNGNMLADGQAVYTYNTANKLVGVTKGTSSIVYAYSGLGDRLRQIADGVTTDYTLDIIAGLTQVLDDGTNKYLYGNFRIAQIAVTQTSYFLPDSLGSMRQMSDTEAELTLARNYNPQGVVIGESGQIDTKYGFDGEAQDGTLIYLRSRYYNSLTGVFMSKDTWKGDNFEPISHNPWLFVGANSVNRTDPTGLCWTKSKNILDQLSHFFEPPFLGPCKDPNNEISCSATIIPTLPKIPTATTTRIPPTLTPTFIPTITPTIAPMYWEDLGDFQISHYVTALEDDDYFKNNGPAKDWADQTNYAPGLDPNKKYNINWLYSDRGILFQGQGLSHFNEYVTKDWIASQKQKMDIFKYDKGGRYGPPREWQTVATGDARLKPHDWVKIDAYPDKGPFEVLDTGEQVGNSHLDVFIGDKTILEADTRGIFFSNISVLRR